MSITKHVLSKEKVKQFCSSHGVKAKCCYCKKSDNLTRDHILPRKWRSLLDIDLSHRITEKRFENNQLLCFECHRKKSMYENKLLDEYKNKQISAEEVVKQLDMYNRHLKNRRK